MPKKPKMKRCGRCGACRSSRDACEAQPRERPEFSRIVEINDWNNTGFYVGVKAPKGTHSHGDFDQHKRLKNGEALEVLWPDGTTLKTKAEVSQVGVEYNDHGHDIRTVSDELVLPISIYGAIVRLTDFSKIKVRRLTP